MRKYRVQNRSALIETSLRSLWGRIRIFARSQGESSLSGIWRAITETTQRYLTTLGKPLYSFKEIGEEDSPDPIEFSATTADIANDINVGYDESNALNDMSVATHNYTAVKFAELRRRADKITGLAGDLRILAAQQGSEALVFSDNFADETKIDHSFPLDTAYAETMPGQGSLTLSRTGALSVPPENITIEVRPISPTTLKLGPTRDNLDRFYEGHLYATLGEAEPEGDNFHLSEQMDQNRLTNYTQEALRVPEPAGVDKKGNPKFTKEQLRNYVVPGGFEARFLEQVQAGVFSDISENKLVGFIQGNRAKFHRKDAQIRRSALYFFQHPDEGEIPDASLGATPENVILVENGADESELQTVRKKMIDGNPASYWQCEFYRRSTNIQDQVEANKTTGGIASLSVSDIRQLVQSADNADFEVEILMKFASPFTLNWITIQPMDFDEGCWLEITDLSTAEKQDGEFIPIESFVDGTRPTTLTDQANQQLSSSDQSVLLAPNASSYRGLGVWPFAARQVSIVRFRIKQRSPSPNPYETMVIETTRSSVRRRN